VKSCDAELPQLGGEISQVVSGGNFPGGVSGDELKHLQQLKVKFTYSS